MSSADDRYHLAVRTSMLSEFRSASGKLGAFELSGHFTSVGALCSALARQPGVRFDDVGASLWAAGRNRFTFRSRAYEVTAPFDVVRVAPVETAGEAYAETEELLRLVKESVMPTWQARARRR